MMFKAKQILLTTVAAGACMTTAAIGQTLTTAPSNNGSGGVYMDLTALNQNLRVTQFDVTYTGTVGSPVDVEVWVRTGSYVGFESDPSAWTLTQTIPGTRQGTAVPSPLVLNDPIELPQGEVTGVYLHCITSGGGIRYTGTGTNPPQTFWSNADISLSGDIARTGNTPFGGSIFTPRTFSGTIYYEPSGPADPFDVRMSASADNDRIGVDENVTITYDIRNPSLENVTGVEVTVDIPSGMSYVSDDRGGSVSAGTFTANLGNLAAGDDTTLNLVLKGDEGDDYSITGEVSINENDPNLANNSATVEVLVIDATLRVLLTGAAGTGAGTGDFLDVQDKLLGTGRFLEVDAHNANTAGTLPTLAQLQSYDAVMVWSNGTYISDIDLGNLLADYVDAGGGVVCAVFETSTTTAGRSLLGRWASENYWVIQQRSGNSSGFASLGTILDPTHPTAQGVSSLTASSAFRPSTTMLVPGGQTIATWDDGIPLIAINDAMPGRVDLGMYPPSSDAGGSWWQVGTDGDVIMANALEYVAGASPTCRPDINGDGVVDADDFFEFLVLFAAGDLRADFNNDGVIDADDFFMFLNEFAAGC